MSAGPHRPHQHEHRPARLGAAASINAGFAVVQVVAGLAIGSVVVLADAAHQTVDALGLVTAWIALRIARRDGGEAWSYGLGKADALGGLVSALLLVASVAWIVVESIRRLTDPGQVDGSGVIAIGLLAIVVNGAGLWLVGHGHRDDAISLRAARLHLITDLAGSVVVVAAGVVIAATGWTQIDALASLALCAAVSWSTWHVLTAAGHVLLDRSPVHVSPTDVRQLIERHDEVTQAHHVHVRSLGGGRHLASAHVVIDGARSVHDAQLVAAALEREVERSLGVDHLTVQFECHPCTG